MISSVINIAFYLMCWVMLSILLCWASSVLYAPLSRVLESYRSASATRYTLWFAFLAPLSAGLSTLILAKPELATHFVVDHCHNEVCEPHGLYIGLSSLLSSSSLALALATILVLSFTMFWQLRSNVRLGRMLQQLTEADVAGYRLLDDSKPVARCVGLLKPRVYFSRGLLASINKEQENILLARYLARVARYENLSYWLLKWASVGWPSKAKQAIRQDFLQRSANSCDVQAYTALQDSVSFQSFADALKSNAQATSKDPAWQKRVHILQRELTELDYQIDCQIGHQAAPHIDLQHKAQASVAQGGSAQGSSAQGGNAQGSTTIATAGLYGYAVAAALVALSLVYIVLSIALGHPMIEAFAH